MYWHYTQQVLFSNHICHFRYLHVASLISFQAEETQVKKKKTMANLSRKPKDIPTSQNFQIHSTWHHFWSTKLVVMMSSLVFWFVDCDKLLNRFLTTFGIPIVSRHELLCVEFICYQISIMRTLSLRNVFYLKMGISCLYTEFRST